MSGFEVASITLAVLPLVISAAENYANVCRRFMKFRKFSAELQEFQTLLKIQRTIFREECRLLVGQVAGEDESCDMFKDPSHPSWQDRKLSEELDAHLHTSKDACIANINLIAEKLQVLEHGSEEFDKVTKKGKEYESMGDKAWRKRIGKKLKFIFSESNLDRSLRQLQELNDNFRRITDQLSRNKERRSSSLYSIPREQRRDIENFRLIQNVSSHLYNALGNACTKHSEHAAHLCLQPTVVEGYDSQIHFRISFSPLSSMTAHGTRDRGDPIWVAIESTVGRSHIKTSDMLSDANTSLKRGEPSSLQDNRMHKEKRKAVHSQSPSPPPHLPMEIPVASLKPNFCNRIKNFPQYCQDSYRCLGVLEETSDYKHLVYLPSPPLATSRKLPTSLEKLFKSLSKSSSPEGLPTYEKLRFAKLLATAVLQFHATPWLRGSWGSQDVLLFDLDTPSPSDRWPIEKDQDQKVLTSPYMNVPVRGSNGSPPQSPTYPSRAFAPNPLLFGLGVMLLELAFEKPLRSMQLNCDLGGCQENRYAEFFTAKRLNHTASTKMGPRYSEIIRKCLQCDFGRGDDLNKPELQEGFYREVVCELGTLEGKFRELQLGP